MQAISAQDDPVASPPVLQVRQAARHLSDGRRSSHITIGSLALHAGETSILCGPSGIGKTTVLEMLSLAARPDHLEMMTVSPSRGRSVDVADLWARGEERELERLRGGVFGYIVQTSRLFPFLSAWDNITVPQRLTGRHDEAHALALCHALGIEDHLKARPGQLSGGQRQRVCIARALSHRPTIVLADEPTSSVDPELGEAIMSLLMDYATEHGAALLVITHNQTIARRSDVRLLDIDSRASSGVLRTRVDSAARHDATRLRDEVVA